MVNFYYRKIKISVFALKTPKSTLQKKCQNCKIYKLQLNQILFPLTQVDLS